MRADRLVAIVLLLQVRGRLTAGELAERLETSERTVRRDLDALCVAGVPVWSQRGRGGGWELLGDHRIDLTGLTAGEAQALFLATEPGSGPTTLGPGFDHGLRAARLKLLAALPQPLRAQVESAGASFLVDPLRWGHVPDADPAPSGEDPEPVHLDRIGAAVLAGVQVIVSYEPPGRPAADRRLHPHGLVCKRGVWYLVATSPDGLRTYRLSRVRSVLVTDDPAQRPPDFDLAGAWDSVKRRLAERVPAPVTVGLLVEADVLRRLRGGVGARWLIEENGFDVVGRARVEIRFPSARVAAVELAPFGIASSDRAGGGSSRAGRPGPAVGRPLRRRRLTPEGPTSERPASGGVGASARGSGRPS